MKRGLTLILTCILAVGLLLSGCGSANKVAATPSPTAAAPTESAATSTPEQAAKTDFIADRVITIKDYRVGITLPEDQVNNPVFKTIKETTGIQVQIDNMKGQDIIQELSVDLAAGDLADVLTGYCEGTNNSNNANLVALLAKAGVDGTFYDMKADLEKANKYNKFLDENYLTKDAKENMIMRNDFNGAIYLLQMEIPRPDVPTAVWVGGAGLYIRNDIAQSLGIDPATIKTNEDLYELAKKIKAGSFVDGNGNPCPAPIGPTIWGAASDPAYAAPQFDFGNTTGFDYVDGTLKHIFFTDYVYNAVMWERKLIAEGLLAKEAYAIQGQQATEAFANAKYPITYMHPFSQSWDGGSDVLRSKNKDKMYIPLGPMTNNKGSSQKVVARRGNTFVAITAGAKNPSEIVKFMDWCATLPGKRLINNGIENVDYTLQDRKFKEYLNYTTPDADDDSKDPIPTQDFTDKAATDSSYKINKGIGIPPLTYLTNVDMYQDLAASFGLGAPDSFPFDYGRDVLKKAAPDVKIIDGIPAGGVLDRYPNIKQLKPVLDLYNDTVVKAIYAESDDAAKQILDAYKKQLTDAGIEDAAKFLQAEDQKNPGSIIFYLTN